METWDQALYDRALDLAARKHAGQTRIGGLPYITHPISVARIVWENGGGMDAVVVALFHDLLEDTDVTEEEIFDIGGGSVLEAVRLLTKHKGYVMADYVGSIRKNPVAFAVKGADRLHNLQCAVCTNDSFKRRYILESVDWYMDFMPAIPLAVKNLAESMDDSLLQDLPVDYQSIASQVVRRYKNKGE